MFKKSLLLMLLMALLAPWAANAQTTVEIGDGTTASYYTPIGTLYNYSITEQLYTAEEIGMAGTINSLSFYYALSVAKDFPIAVYMANVDAADLSTGISLADAELVFDGTLSVTEEGWATIDLATPFEYDGTSNLLIGVNKGYLQWFSGASWRYTSATNMARYSQNDNSAYDLTTTPATAIANRPNIQMEITPSGGQTCEKPQTLEASNITTNSAVLTWTGGSGTYNVEYKKSSETEWTAFIANTTNTTCTLTSLNENTAYQARVQSVCTGATSGWKTVSFTTANPCAAPTALQISDITTNSAVLSWTPGYQETRWTVKYKKSSVSSWDDAETVIANSPTITLTNLDEDTQYNVQVYNCDDVTPLSGSFYTSEGCPNGFVCIGTGHSTNSYVPTYTFYNYALTQQIYTAEEINGAGAIMSIGFYSTASERTRNLDIYMVYTDKNSFESNTDYITVAATDLVYSGSVTFVQSNWTTITLDSPFQYADDTQNVALIVHDKTNSYVSSPAFYSFAASNQVLYSYNDNYGYDPFTPGTYVNGTTYNFTLGSNKNRIRLGMGELSDCDMPTNLAVSNITGQTANLTWTAGGSETAWQVCVNGDEANAINVTSNTYQLTGLTAATVYTVKVRANCGSSYSYWTPEVSFNTAICDETDQCEISYEFTLTNTSYTSWHSATIDVVDVATNIVIATVSYDIAPTGTVSVCNGREIKFVYNPASPAFYNSYNGYSFTDVNGEVIFSGAATSSMSTATVLYTYAVDCTVTNCKRPTDLAASEIGNHSAKLSWTENGEATEWVVAYKVSTDDIFEEVSADAIPFVLTRLRPETEYAVKVRPVCEPGVEKWSDAITFTTDVACPAPTNLNVDEITSNSAVISWEGEGSFDLRYATVESSKSTLFYDFESGLGDWTTIDGDGDGFTWTLLSEIESITTSYETHAWGVDGSDAVFSGSYINGASVTTTPDNLLVSPMVTLGGSISFYAKGLDGSYPEHFGVCVSTTSNTDVNAFTVLQEWDTDTDTEYHEYTVDLSAYSGQGYIAIRDFNVVDMYIVIVDNVTIEEGVAGNINWSDPISVTSPYTMTGLEPKTTYLVQVRANCGDDGTSGWIQKGFVTKGVCDTPTALSTTDVDASSATLSWTGIQSGYNVQYRTAEHTETLFFTDFDDVVPTGWTNEGAYYYWTGTTDYWIFLGYTEAGTQHLITSDLTEYAGASTIAFKQRYYGSAMNFKVGFSRGTNNLDDFEWSDDIAATSSETLYSVPIPSGANYFAIQATSETSQTQGIIIDDFGIYGEAFEAGQWVSVERVTSPHTLEGLTASTVYEWQVQGICPDDVTEWSAMATFTTEPSCLVPTDLTVSDITSESAVLAWVSVAELFDIQLNGTVVAQDVTNPYTLTLESGTSYKVKVRAHCGGDDYSDWSSFISFTTPCNAFDLPYEYGFDDAATSENPEFNCWMAQSFNTTNAVSLVYRDEEAGDVMFRFSSYSNATDYRQILVSPELNTTEAIQVEFEYKASHSSAESFQVGYSSTLDLNEFEWEDVTSTSGTDWNTYSTIAPAGTKYVAILYQSEYQYYMYVDNFSFTEATAITQTIDLISGWNWVSIGIAVDDPVDMLDMLKASLGENALEIQSVDYTTEYDGEEWFGDLDDEGVFNEQMYLINAENDCTIELTGMPAVANEYEITIYPGWNWIGFPSAVAIDVVDALADFDAAEGDEIQDIDYTTEFDGDDWFGDLETFEPGKGLLYNNTTDETKTLIFATGAKKTRNAKPVFGTFKNIPVQTKMMSSYKSIVDPIKKYQTKKH